MKNHIFVIMFTLFAGIVLSGCINLSSLQTAEALKEGEGRVIMGAGYYTSPSVNEALNKKSDEEEAEGVTVERDKIDDIKVPYAEVGYRYGVMDKLEIGGKLTIIGTMGLDAKYQFLDAGDFDMAAGLGLAYMTLESSSGSGDDETKYKNVMIDTTVPLYISYRLANSFAFYTTPKYILRTVSTKATMGDEEDSSSDNMSLVGATVGMMIGSDWGLALEGTYMKDTDSEFDMLQVSTAIFF